MVFITGKDLEKIEKELNVVLPNHYKKFHIEEQELIKKMREGDSWSSDNSIYLATDVDWIITFNKRMGHPKEEGPVRNKICIGGDGCGNFYFLNIIDGNDTRIYFIDHDGYEWEEIFDESENDFRWEHEGLSAGNSLKEFIDFIIKL